MVTRAAAIAEELGYSPTLDQVAAAGTLASRGVLPPVAKLWLHNATGCNLEDLGRVEPGHLAALVRGLTDRVGLIGVKGDLGEFLREISCNKLGLHSISLSQSDIATLGIAMATRVEKLGLSDISPNDALSQILAAYDGLGRCGQIELSWFPEAVGKMLKDWAMNRGWVCKKDIYNCNDIVERN